MDIKKRKTNMQALKQTWNFDKTKEIYDLPFNDLIFLAHKVFWENFDQNKVQISTLLNIKQGRCSENCSYCSQSAHFKTKLPTFPLLDIKTTIASAKKAKAIGTTRSCMAAAWRGPRDKDMPRLIQMVQKVKRLGLETCLSAGLLTKEQAKDLKKAGLDFYNHNIDTSEEYYQKIITTRKFSDRVETLKHVSDAGINMCCGGIVGMGESKDDRIKMIVFLSNLRPQIKSVPINLHIKMPGTPLENSPDLDRLELVRSIATTRILIPQTYVRLSAGRTELSGELQALCFLLEQILFFMVKNYLPLQILKKTTIY